MKNWLKGGLIALGVFVLGVILQLAFIASDQFIVIQLIFFLGENVFRPPIMFLLFAIGYFAIGAIIGLIIDKVKK
jgi:hypothetical protein